jgi:pectate lyase
MFIVSVFSLSLVQNSLAKEVEILKAFPTAEGSGAKTVGGRGGRVIEVTNLNASGAGSFKEACEAEGKRTIVFRVGGTIDLNGAEIIIRNDYLTIAGQTAPGEGIQLKNGGISIRANEVIVRYLRIRPGPADTMIDALNIVSPSRHDRKKNVIIDHVSAFWGIDETMNAGSFFNNVTMQWSIIAEGLHCSIYDNAGVKESWKPCNKIDGRDRWAHSRGSMVNSDSRDITYHHNLLYRNYKRNPLIQSSDGNIINNVMVNYQYQVYVEPFEEKVRANFIGNYFRTYLHIRPPIRVYDLNKGYDGKSGVYYRDNYDSKFRPNSTYAENSIRIFHKKNDTKGDGHIHDRLEPYLFDSVKIEPVQEAYKSVLEKVGASYPKRDSADERVIAFVRSGKAPKTLINNPSEVGGWPTLKGGKALVDSDHDGMPNSWERTHGLNPKIADGNLKTLSSLGYTNLEVYLNSLVK